MSNLFDKTTQGLGAAINMRLLRQNVTTSNIANAETPGYKAKKLDFEAALSSALDIEGKGALSVSDPNHFAVGSSAIGNVRAEIYDNPDVNMSNDGNTVDMEREMANLAENTVLYRAAIQLINKKLASMKYAASDGGQ